jgi:hypothetical protein
MSTKQFYLLCLIGVTFIGGMVMLLLWRQIKLKSSENRGMLFLSLAMFSWTIVGIYKYYDPPMPSLVNAINDRILSAFSNLFVLASLPYFPSVFEGLKERFTFFRKPEQWVNNVFIFFAVITVVFTLIDRNIESDTGKKIIIAIDSFISTAAISLISYALYQSISRFWQDKYLKMFLFVMFIVLISTQITLPMIAIFPGVLKPIYMGALILLLLGMVFFNFISVAYFGMVSMEMKEIASHESEKSKLSNVSIESLNLGYDATKKLYFISIGIKSVEKIGVQEYTIFTSKLLLPFANWILFAIAKKHNVKLSHVDLSTTKFRMVEFWNKESAIRISQENLFNNDRGNFDLKMDNENIHLENLKFLHSKFIIREAIIKHEDCFASLNVELSESKDLSKTQIQEQLVKKIFDWTK